MKWYSIYLCYYLQLCTFGREEFIDQACGCKPSTHTPPKKPPWFQVTKICFWLLLHGLLCRGAAAVFPLYFPFAAQAEEAGAALKNALQKGWARVLGASEAHSPHGRGSDTVLSHEFIIIQQTCHITKPECCGTALYHPLVKNEE